jgi:hypothetical protein
VHENHGGVWTRTLGQPEFSDQGERSGVEDDLFLARTLRAAREEQEKDGNKCSQASHETARSEKSTDSYQRNCKDLGVGRICPWRPTSFA